MIEKLIEKINATVVNGSSLVVNNLFQSQAFNGSERDWQANLRTADPNTSFFEFGRGATAAEALEKALGKALNATPGSNDMPKFLSKAHVSVKAVRLEDIL